MSFALVCFGVAIVNRNVYPDNVLQIDTAGTGWTAYAPLDGASAPRGRLDSFELWDPYLWVGAGMALFIVAVCIAGIRLRRARA